MMDEGTDQMDPHTVYHIKGDVIWALGPKAKHEITRGQRGRELKDVEFSDLFKLFKKTFIPARNVFPRNVYPGTVEPNSLTSNKNIMKH